MKVHGKNILYFPAADISQASKTPVRHHPRCPHRVMDCWLLPSAGRSVKWGPTPSPRTEPASF